MPPALPGDRYCGSSGTCARLDGVSEIQRCRVTVAGLSVHDQTAGGPSRTRARDLRIKSCGPACFPSVGNHAGFLSLGPEGRVAKNGPEWTGGDTSSVTGSLSAWYRGVSTVTRSPRSPRSSAVNVPSHGERSPPCRSRMAPRRGRRSSGSADLRAASHRARFEHDRPLLTASHGDEDVLFGGHLSREPPGDDVREVSPSSRMTPTTSGVPRVQRRTPSLRGPMGAARPRGACSPALLRRCCA